MKNKKHLLFIALLTAVTITAFAQQYDPERDFEITKYDSVYQTEAVIITKYVGKKRTVSIPPTIQGLPVTIIRGIAFKGCTNLTSIIIPDSVTNSALLFSQSSEGSFQIFIDLYGTRAGKYERRNKQWYYNGTVMTEPARLICQNDKEKGNIYISKIDSKTSSSASLVRIPGGSRFGSVSLLPGLYSVSVGWIHYEEGKVTEYSRGEVTFEYVYTFESGVYDLTGDKQGEQIVFRIRKR